MIKMNIDIIDSNSHIICNDGLVQIDCSDSMDVDTFDNMLDKPLISSQFTCQNKADLSPNIEEKVEEKMEEETKIVDDVEVFNESKLVINESIALVRWEASLCLGEITVMKGNFWKYCGFSLNQKNYLYPEEALYLAERRAIRIRRSLDEIGSENNNRNNKLNNGMPKTAYHFTEFYELILGHIPIAFYLTYLKLKSLEYVVLRRNSNSVHSITSDADIVNLIRENPTGGLLNTLVSFDIFPHNKMFSKNANKRPKPTAYVIVTAGYKTLPGRVLLKLLEEAGKVPIIVSALMPTGHVMLEEFTDALNSIDWSNDYKINL